MASSLMCQVGYYAYIHQWELYQANKNESKRRERG
jgi:hypothetical protein